MFAVFEAPLPSDARRQMFGLRAYRILLTRQRYADALTAYPFTAAKKQVERRQTVTYSMPPDARVLAMRRKHEATTMVEFVAVLAGAGAVADATAMVAMPVEFDASPATQQLLEEALKRAGSLTC